jgi:hypothetical protein
MAKPDRQKFTAGVVLVLIGVGFYLVQRLETIGNEVIMLIIGAAFLVAYFYQKAYGLLIPAGILLGLGVGEVLQSRFWWAHDGVQLGLGLGFISIYVIARLYERSTHWWPLIPGVILLIIGVPKTARIFRFLFDNWPLILVAIGLLILIGAFRRGPDEAAEETPVASPDPQEPAAPASASEPEEPVEPRIE